MSQGENILTLVRGIQKLHGEIAALLKTFEKLAGEKGYLNRKGNAALSDRATSIENPEKWSPYWMYRQLEHKTNKDDVLAVNVLLDALDESQRQLIIEPLVLFSRFQYKRGAATSHAGDADPWDIWFSRPSKELDRIYTKKDLGLDSAEFLEDSGWEKADGAAMLDVRFLAKPLASMTDSKTLANELNRLF